MYVYKSFKIQDCVADIVYVVYVFPIALSIAFGRVCNQLSLHTYHSREPPE